MSPITPMIPPFSPAKHLFRLAVLLSAALPSVDAALVFPEKRRVETIEKLELLLEYAVPDRSQLRLIPDPFKFGRAIPEEESEDEFAGVDSNALLARIASRFSGSLIGYQEFGGRAFFPTREFGLLKDGDVVTINPPELDGQAVSIQIIAPSREGFTIRLNENLETFVPSGSMPSGIRPTDDRSSNPTTSVP